MIEVERRFKKWQWIEATIEKATVDHRPESHRLYSDTITCRDVLGTADKWASRRMWLEKMPAFEDLESIDAASASDSISLALARPKRLLELEIIPADNPDWTDEERRSLLKWQRQGDLFPEEQALKDVAELRKLPFKFYYRFVCDTPGGEKEYRHKIVDWEVGALYWKCQGSHGANWEEPLRAKLEDDLGNKELMLLMGNQHRFQDQWLIISLIYPPKRTQAEEQQQSLV